MACWDNYPLTNDMSDPPGTRWVNGRKYRPKKDEPCVMIDPDGYEWEAFTPPAGTKPETDPKGTLLSAFPQFPVPYLQEASLPDAADVIKAVMVKDDQVSGNAYSVVLYSLIAARWIDLAERHASTATDPALAKQWVARLRHEMSNPSLNAGCTVFCGSVLRGLYLIANAAAYMAGYWARQSLVPPRVPSQEVINRLAEKLINPVKDLVTSKTGLYVVGGIAAAALAFAIVRKKL